MSGDLDEFGDIARLWRPLAGPEGLDLADDAALIPAQAGELVVTTDTLVEGVHFLPDDPLETVAAKLLRVNLSDLAAKAAEPYGWLLTVAWPQWIDAEARARFAAALGEEQARFGLRLFGGDTVSTPGPLTLGATLFGRVPPGAMVRRAGARPGDVLLVSGTIGDAGLGLEARLTPNPEVTPENAAAFIARYRTPEPRLALRAALRAHAAAAADVSDGLLADAGHVAAASGCGVEVALDALPLSPPAARWLARQSDRAAGLARLAASGDDYEVVCAARPDATGALQAEAARSGTPMTVVGRFTEGPGLVARCDGAPVAVSRAGWTHGGSSPAV